VRIGSRLEQQIQTAFLRTARDKPGSAISPAQGVLKGRKIQPTLGSGGAVTLGAMLFEDGFDMIGPEIRRGQAG
jgi:hypothetical protein